MWELKPGPKGSHCYKNQNAVYGRLGKEKE